MVAKTGFEDQNLRDIIAEAIDNKNNSDTPIDDAVRKLKILLLATKVDEDWIKAMCETYKKTHRLTIASNGHHLNELEAYEHGLRTAKAIKSVRVEVGSDEIDKIIDAHILGHVDPMIIDNLKTQIKSELYELKTMLRDTFNKNSGIAKELNESNFKLKELQGPPEIKYRHERTGAVYVFVSKGLVQIDGEWQESINYKNPNQIVPFTRTAKDFNAKFTLIQ